MPGNYTLPNGITTDWDAHSDDYKTGTDRNWKVTDWKLVPWVKKQIATVGDLPGGPANGDAYLIGGTEVHRWNSNTSSYDVFVLTGAFRFYDEFLDTYYNWTFGTIEADGNTVLNTNGDMLYYDSGLQRLPKGNELDVVQYVGGLPTTQRLPLYDLRIKRPSFKFQSTTEIVIPATVTSPTRVKILDNFYKSTSNKVLDITDSGRGGLTTGSVAANTVYYLYAIPPVSGDDYDIVIDENDPSVGPTAFVGFDPLNGYSYIGSFKTDAGALLVSFTYSNGFFLHSGDMEAITVSDSTIDDFDINISVLASSAYFRGICTALDAAGDNLNLGPNADDVNQYMNTADTSGHSAVCFFFVPIQTPSTIFGSTTDDADSFEVMCWGWVECPEDYD